MANEGRLDFFYWIAINHHKDSRPRDMHPAGLKELSSEPCFFYYYNETAEMLKAADAFMLLEEFEPTRS